MKVGNQIGQIGMNGSITTGFTLKKEKTSVPPVFVTAMRAARLRTRAPALGFAAVHLMMQNTSEKNLKIYITIILDKKTRLKGEMSNNLFTPEDSERIELLCQLNRLEAPVEKLRELVVYTEKYNRKKEREEGKNEQSESSL